MRQAVPSVCATSQHGAEGLGAVENPKRHVAVVGRIKVDARIAPRQTIQLSRPEDKRQDQDYADYPKLRVRGADTVGLGAVLISPPPSSVARVCCPQKDPSSQEPPGRDNVRPSTQATELSVAQPQERHHVRRNHE